MCASDAQAAESAIPITDSRQKTTIFLLRAIFSFASQSLSDKARASLGVRGGRGEICCILDGRAVALMRC